MAKALGLDAWTPSEGSETWEGDVAGTVYQLLRDSGAIDDYDHTPAAKALAAERAASALLRAAISGVDRDFMTSEKHHPGYVLIPAAKFEQLCVALHDAPAPIEHAPGCAALDEAAEPQICDCGGAKR